MVSYTSDTRQEKNSEVGNGLLLKSIDENFSLHECLLVEGPLQGRWTQKHTTYLKSKQINTIQTGLNQDK